METLTRPMPMNCGDSPTMFLTAPVASSINPVPGKMARSPTRWSQRKEWRAWSRFAYNVDVFDLLGENCCTKGCGLGTYETQCRSHGRLIGRCAYGATQSSMPKLACPLVPW